jgi:hypothetical protein
VSKWQRSKQAQLKVLEKHPTGKVNALARRENDMQISSAPVEKSNNA